MVIMHNLTGMAANRQLNVTTGVVAKSSEKLSSGYKINRAADDATGLSISERMRRQIHGLDRGLGNAQDGISYCQVADGALNEVDAMLERVKTLAVKASTETLTDSDRTYINAETERITEEINRINKSCCFNEKPIFNGGLDPNDWYNENYSITVNVGAGKTVEIEMPFVDSDGNKVDSTTETAATGTPNGATANTAIAKFAQNAAAFAINKLSENFPKLFNAASSDNIKIGLNLANIDGLNNALASAGLGITSSSDSTVMTYTMNVDTTDFPISSFDIASDQKKADLAAVIGHEMTHLIMYDTLTFGMTGTGSASFPKWFVEGMAQTTSGDNDWVSSQLSPTSSDSAIKTYMSKLSNNEYGAGYLATMYLGQLASGSDVVTSANIRAGLDNLLEYMAQGHTLNDAIAAKTTYSGLSSFESGFKSGDAKSLKFVKDLLAARGTNGAGSLLGELNDSEFTVFGNVNGVVSANYNIMADNTKYSNAFGSGYVFPDSGGSGGSGGGGAGIVDTENLFALQVGSENTKRDRIQMRRYAIDVDTLTGGKGFDLTTADNARATLDTLNKAAFNVSRIRSYYGAVQNRLEHTADNLANVTENTTSAESRIRDTDMAKEMVQYSNNNILLQAGQAMVAQANQTKDHVMALLQ